MEGRNFCCFRKKRPLGRWRQREREGTDGGWHGDTGKGNWGKMSSPPLELSEREIDTRRYSPALLPPERAGEYAFASLRLTLRNLRLNLQQESAFTADDHGTYLDFCMPFMK